MMFAIFSVLARGSQWFNSSAALVDSELVSLLPDGILNLFSLFELLAGPHQPCHNPSSPTTKEYLYVRMIDCTLKQ